MSTIYIPNRFVLTAHNISASSHAVARQSVLIWLAHTDLEYKRLDYSILGFKGIVFTSL